MAKCKGTTRVGKPCPFNALPGKQFCKWHSGGATKKRVKYKALPQDPGTVFILSLTQVIKQIIRTELRSILYGGDE